MRRLGFILILTVFAGEFLAAGEAWLRWRNGDELKGTFLESREKRIQWQAAPFAAPLDLNLDQLESIRFSSENKKPSKSSAEKPEFRVIMTNGDRLDGALTAIDQKSVTVSCAPFTAPVVIEKGAIERIVHINSDYLRYSGPDDLSGWTSSGRDRKTTEWFTDLKGAFATHQWSGNLFREIEFPSAVEIQFSAEFPLGNPNLEIGLIREAHNGPRIETWDDFLVLTYRSRFVPIFELTPDTKRLDFRLFWNQENGDLQLCAPSGELLASLDKAFVDRRDPKSTKPRAADPLVRGFSILNRNPELKLNSLTVQEWDGHPVPVVDLSRPRVLLAGRAPRFGIDDVTLSTGSPSLRVGGRSHSLAEVQQLIFSPSKARPGPSVTPATRIAWFGGTTISGDFESLGKESISITPLWTTTPVQITLTDAREIQFPTSPKPIARSGDHLEGEGFSLHGATRPLVGGHGNQLLGWQAPGSQKPIPFADGLKAKVTRTPYAASNSTAPNLIGQGRVYLENDEILVGSLISITKEKVHFTSRITGLLEIPTDLVRAVDIGGAGRVLEGFGDPEWEEIEEDENEITVTKDKAIIRGGSLGNPSLLLGDRLRFTTEWDQAYGAITLRLFADGPDEASPSTDVIIAAQGNRLFVGKLKESGAFSFSGDQIPISENKASFEIDVEPEKIRVLVNGKSTLTIAVDPNRVSGNGLYFKMGGGWQGWNQNENEITLSKFRIERAPGSIPRRIIDSKAKENALLVPRSRRDPLPSHLIVAPNGDLLRGRLQAASGDSIRFTSKNETFELPRSRVSAIVWLSKPEPEEGAANVGGEEEPARPQAEKAFDRFEVTHQFTLMDGSRLRLHSKRIENNRFVGESAILGECTIAITNIREMRRGPGTPTRELEKSGISAFSDWQLTLTPEPNIPGTEEAPVSPLIGKPAPPIDLTMLGNEEKFNLAKLKGRVVVLDFWATWCGPCIKAMPDVRDAIDAFPKGSVTFCAINQAETVPIVTDFLKARSWEDTPVALDFRMAVSNSYQVKGIPHTVVVAKDGTIAWSHSGYSKDLKEKLFEAIAKELQANQ